MHAGNLYGGANLSEKLPDFTICNLGNFPELNVTIIILTIAMTIKRQLIDLSVYYYVYCE